MGLNQMKVGHLHVLWRNGNGGRLRALAHNSSLV